MIEIKTKTMPATPRSKKYPVGASVLHTSGGTTIMQGGGSGESVDIVKRDDIRSFTDANVLSALRALAEFISKKDDSDITAIVNYLNGLKIKGNHVNRLLLKDTEADVVSDTDVMSALRVLSEIAANNEDLKGKFLSKLNPDETKHLLRLLGGLYVENGIHTDTLEASGNISAQNISATETISGQDITASENITGKNVSATESVSGQSISATETISGKNITASETVSTQNVDATGTVSANMIDATETISGKNVLASESVAGENITASNTASGKNVTAKETISGKNATISQKTTTLNLLVQALANVYDLNVSHVATLFQTVIKDYISSELYTPGLTGSGMKLYKAVAGDWNLELDNLTVRKAMTIFELIISKIRAVNGGLVVSPANGKVKSVLLTNDIYRLEIEGDMMFVADDLVRCQTFAKTGTKYYWVRITSVSGQYIFINKTEFTSSVPAVGDDLVQFGNKTNAARQGVLYLTASEDGKPRFSVLNGVNSTDLTGKTKVILGCLDGITDTAFSADSQPSGYGLYSENVFLKGIFVLKSGKKVEEFINDGIASVQVGGRNLLANSDFSENSLSKWVGSQDKNYTLSIENSELKIVGLQGRTSAELNNSWNTAWYVAPYSFNVAGDYTISFDAYALKACTLYFRANYYTYPTYGGAVQIGTEKKRYSVVFKNNTNENSRLLGFVFSVATTLYLDNVKLELGNKATDWTPAPEDVDTRITNVETQFEIREGIISSKVTEATTAATNAKKSETSASTSASTATTKATAAASSATSASGSATTAGQKATAAANSATAAATSATNAQKAAESAETVLEEVTTKESSITQTAGQIATKVTEVNKKVTEATTAATTATTKATAAATSATNAKTSETNAGTKATAAANSATTAGTKATAAANSATAAAGSATNAKSSADSAAAKLTTITEKESSINQTASQISTKVTEVTKKATEAATSASNAASSATSASGSASTATTKATAAAGSAAAAATSATNAKSSADTAAAKLTTITQKESSINQTASSITTKVTEVNTKASQAATSATNAANSASTAGTKATAAANSAELALAMSKGKMIYRDPSFKSGLNSCSVYNNSGNGNVTVTRVSGIAGNPNSSGYCLKVKTTGTASPERGGFYWGATAKANRVLIVRLIANIPTGYTLKFATNALGTGASHKWLTAYVGTGKWEEYAYKIVCGASGTFSSTGFFYLSGGSAPTTAAPLEWHICYATMFDVTDAEIDYISDAAAKYTTKTEHTSSITQLSNSIELKVAKTDFNALGTRVSSAETTIKQHTDSIALKAAKTDVTALGTRMTAAEAKITPDAIKLTVKSQTETIAANAKQAAITDAAGKYTTKTEHSSSITQLNNSIALKVAKTDFNALGTRVGSAETTIKQHTDQIALKAAKTDVTALGTRVSAAEAKITPDAIKLTVKSQTDTIAANAASNAVNGIKIGGKNLIRYVTDTGAKYFTGSGATVTVTNGIVRGVSACSTAGWPRIFNSSVRNIVFELNTPYTVSFWVRSNIACTRSFGIAESGGTKAIFTKGTAITTAWTHVIYTFTPTIQVGTAHFFYIYTGSTSPNTDTTNWVEIKEVKLEKGNKATDWTPAPEDVDARITSVQTAFEIREGVISSKVTEATTAATNAKKSETSASTSASTATTKATAAASSATSASGSASTATTKANAAASSATAAATSATNAKSSADSAAAKLTTITQKESSINQTASQISTKVTEVTTKATQAATSATNAKTSETNAGTKATAAANSATTAGTKATAAANSATAAATSATNAAASLTSVTTKQSEINATAAQITLKVTEVTTKTTQATNAAELATAMSKGKMLYRDPTFKGGSYNGTTVYLGTGVTRSYVAVTGCPNPDAKAMKFVATQFCTATDKRIGGFLFGNKSRANAVFVVRIIANIPTGRNLNVYHNSYGTGGATKWLTSTAGAGKWQEYACKVTCGASGTFSTLNHFALTGGAAPTAAAPVTWYVAYATVFDVTDVDDTPSREEIKSGMTITAGGISIFGKELSLAGKVTFSSLDSAAQSTINGKATPAQVATAKSEAISTAATDATTKANNAKSAAISTAATDATTKANNAKSAAISTAATDATTKANNALTNARNDVAVKLGYTSYTDMVNKATAKQTIIDGGFIRTSLIKADDIVTSTLLATKIAATEITTGKLTVTTGAKIGGWNVEGNSLAIRDESEAKILVEPSGYRFLRINDTKGTLMSIRADGVTGIGIYTQNKSGTCLSMIAQTGGTAVESYGSHTFGQRAGETWNAPGVLWAGRIVSNGTIESYWGNGCTVSSRRTGVGKYTITHELKHMQYYVMITGTPWSTDGERWIVGMIENRYDSYFSVRILDTGRGYVDAAFEVAIIGRNKF